MTKLMKILFAVLCLQGGAALAQAIHVVTETTPYTYLKNGRVEGTATEVVERTLERAGIRDYSLHVYPWARAYDLALKEPGVLIFLIARTPARERRFHWAGEIMKIEYHLYRLREREEIAVNTLDDARNYVIGVMRDDVRQQYLQGKGFTRLVISAQWTDNFRKLLNRQVDLVPLTEDDASRLCIEAAFDCANLERVLTLDEASTGLYMAWSLMTPDEIVERSRVAFEALRTDGTVHRIMTGIP
jgi:polar amino acid transport system substrate-binding protein